MNAVTLDRLIGYGPLLSVSCEWLAYDAEDPAYADRDGEWQVRGIAADGEQYWLASGYDHAEANEFAAKVRACLSLPGDDATDSFQTNIAAISADFHTHPRFGEFLELMGPTINGFIGVYPICVRMARALTNWEFSTEAGTAIYEIVGWGWPDATEEFAAAMIARILESGEVPDAEKLLRAMIEAKA